VTNMLKKIKELKLYIIDSDDYIAEDMVEKLVNAAESCGADLALCGYFTENSNTVESHLLPYKKKQLVGKDNIVRKYLLPLIGSQPNELSIPGFLCIRLFKKSLIQRSFFGSERIFYKEDHVFNLLYGDEIEKIAVINEPLYYYCFNGESLSNSYRKNKWQMYKNLYAFYRDYMVKRGYDAEERINNYIVSSVFATVDNAVLTGTYTCFNKEIDELVNDPLANNTIHDCKISEIGLSQKITMLLLRFKFYKLLYYIRKLRINS